MNLPWDNRFEQVKESQKAEHPTRRRVVNIIRFPICKRTGVSVILGYPPEYVEGQQLVNNRQAIMNLYRKLAKKHGIP